VHTLHLVASKFQFSRHDFAFVHAKHLVCSQPLGSIFIRRLEKDLAAAHTMLLHQRSHASQELHLTSQLAQGPTSCAACIKMSFKFVLVSAMRSIRSLQLMMGTKPKRLHDEHIV
jgi:hypothetical protein